MKQLLSVVILVGLVLVGCNSENDESVEANETEVNESEKDDIESNDSTEEKKEQSETVSSEDRARFFNDLPKPPESREELLTLPSGKFAGSTFEEQEKSIKEVLDHFPVADEEISDEEAKKYYLKLISLFAEEYPNPKDVIAKWGGISLNPPEINGKEIKFKENYNVEIVLDASGSMANYQGSKTRMELAKEAIMDFAKKLPEEANVGLRIYGFEGTGADSDKEMSCASNELVYGIKPFDEKELSNVMNQFEPMGWTPLADVISAAKSDLGEYDSESSTNIIYIVSDGIETCDGDPVKEARKLVESNVTPVVNVIGFDLDDEGQKQLKNVADAAEGTYNNVTNRKQLQNEFRQAAEVASEWRLWKANAISDAGMESADRAQMIRDFAVEWAENYRNERHSMSEALKYLQYELDTISNEASLKIHDYHDVRADKLFKWKDEAYDELFDLKDKEYEDIVEEINDRYNKNVKDD